MAKNWHYKTSSGHCGGEAILSTCWSKFVKIFWNFIWIFKYFRYFQSTAEALSVIFLIKILIVNFNKYRIHWTRLGAKAILSTCCSEENQTMAAILSILHPRNLKSNVLKIWRAKNWKYKVQLILFLESVHKNCQSECGNFKTLFKWTLTIVMQVLF